MYSLIRPNNGIKNFDWDIFDDFFAYPSFFNYDYPSIKPKILKEENEYKILIPVPGLNKEDIKITIDDGYLNINYEKEEKDNNKHFISTFSKSYRITNDIKEDEIKGTVENGVLEIKLPLSIKKPKQRLIEIT